MNLPLRAIARLLSVAAPCVCFTACRENPVSFYVVIGILIVYSLAVVIGFAFRKPSKVATE